LYSPFQTGSSSTPSYFKILFFIEFLEEAFFGIIIVILCINYIVIICINNNNYYHTVIDNNYGRLQDLILLFRIPMGTQKYFFKIYRQFGHASSKRLASPGICGYA
jgi:hypothetical protein